MLTDHRDSDFWSNDDLNCLLPSWKLALDAANKSSETIVSYLDSVKRLEAYLATEELPLDAPSIRGFLAAERDRTTPASAAKHYRNLCVYFRWLVAEDEIKDNPMLRVEKPKVPEEAKPFFTTDELAALLKATTGKDFETRRDHAIIRILIDTGLRASGLADLRFDPADDKVTDVFLDQLRLRVRLKGGDTWWVPIGNKAAGAIDRYLRVRARSLHAGSPWLWIGTRGHDVARFGDSGIRAMLRRRGRQAGVQNCHPHRFRHTFADSWLALGGNVDDLMNVAGWKSISMPLRYARGRGIARAAEAHKRLSPGDRP
jgi:site-specific recombinase XerD